MNKKPEILYHGSITPNIKILEPRKRFTPGVLGKDIPPAVYAGDIPFYSIGHALPWDSSMGFDIGFTGDEDQICVFKVPKDQAAFLNQKVYLYTVSADKFELLEDVYPKGHNYWSLNPVKVIGYEEFNSVDESLHKYRGTIKFI